MSWRAGTRALTAVVGFALLLALVAGCNLVRTPGRADQVLTLRAEPPSLLVLILGSTSAQAHDVLSTAIVTSARTGEHVVVLGASGRTLGEFTAPKPRAMNVPSAPLPPGGDATSFELAQYRKSSSAYRAAVGRDLRTLRLRELQSVRAWAGQVVARVWSAAQQTAAAVPSVDRSLASAIADEAVLQQAHGGFGARLMLDLIDVPDPDQPPAHVDAGLAGMTVVLTGIPDSLADASWQAALLGAGAVQAYVLPAAAQSLAPGLISRGLTGPTGFPFIVTGLDYGSGQFTVPRRALPSLRTVLRLLVTRYPGATATINAYTDTVPVRGGNLLLSWRRAKAVMAWMVEHGVAAYRLEAIPHGSADPVALNKGAGQPLNRRVVVIVSAGG